MNHKQNTAGQYDRDLEICEAAPKGHWDYTNGVVWTVSLDRFGEPEQEPIADAPDCVGEYLKHFQPTYVTQLIKKAQRCEELEVALHLAIDYIKKSPCDPDIHQEQWEAYDRLTSNMIAKELLK